MEISRNLGGEVETLSSADVQAAVKATLDRLKAGENRVKLLGSRSSTAGVGAWTISGCTPGKPVFIVISADTYAYTYAWLSVISGTYHNDADVADKASGLRLIGGVNSNASTNVLVLIPTSSVCAVKFHGGYGSYTLRAFG